MEAVLDEAQVDVEGKGYAYIIVDYAINHFEFRSAQPGGLRAEDPGRVESRPPHPVGPAYLFPPLSFGGA